MSQIGNSLSRGMTCEAMRPTGSKHARLRAAGIGAERGGDTFDRRWRGVKPHTVDWALVVVWYLPHPARVAVKVVIRKQAGPGPSLGDGSTYWPAWLVFVGGLAAGAELRLCRLPVTSQRLSQFLLHLLHQFRRVEDYGIGTPGKNPPLHLKEVVGGEREDGAAIGPVLDLLSRMPLPLFCVRGRSTVKEDPHAILFGTEHDAEMTARYRQ